jgi:hypothetical protein
MQTQTSTMDVPGRSIMTIQFGSHLYGTSTPASDIDLKSIFVPRSKDILLGRVKGAVSTKRPKGVGEKNYAGEVEQESFSLQRFLGLVAEGQTVSLDILFAPAWAHVEPVTGEWDEIVANRHRLLTRKHGAFVGYCRQQAAKYGIKGSRVAAARGALEIFAEAVTDVGSRAKVSTLDGVLVTYAMANEHVAIVPIASPSGVVVQHFEVCGRKIPYTVSIKEGFDILKRLVDTYGQRALQAESQKGVDWKALSHAVRIGRQAVELFDTGHIDFPSPIADHLVAIKTGQLPYRQVAEEIEAVLVEVEAAAARSTLPEDVDHEWIEQFIEDAHFGEVLCGQ